MTQDERDDLFMLFRHSGYTMKAFAAELGIHTSGVSQWFSGKSVSARLDEAARKKAAELRSAKRYG